jgi:UDP-2,3-diacylglucosamine pyrophosphatase LpxH
MRKLLRKILLKPVLWLAAKFSSKPDKQRIFQALTILLKKIKREPGKRGVILPLSSTSRYIIFSDQHRGKKNGADDFAVAEPNYLAALDYYFQNDFYFISLGDSEELWENRLSKVKKYNTETFEKEKQFIRHNRFVKVFGNHDLFWDNDPLAGWHLKNIYGKGMEVYEGVVLQSTVGSQQSTDETENLGKPSSLTTHNSPLTIFLTHGHQGDASSDGNWFSKFFVANIWAPLQAYLRINPNTPAYDAALKTKHNDIMYEWSSQQKDLILITGHTHQPVFESLTHLERLYRKLQQSRNDKDVEAIKTIEAEIVSRKFSFTDIASDYLKLLPTYFNTGCCCFTDGDITGIEIADGFIRLIKWTEDKEENVRVVLEEKEIKT